ncbi:MAG: J domain-containing protein [Chitinophagia bacterium]|nr:J domain-containing protein [Chitinophagia bacterium]
MARQDYYTTLGITPAATEHDIKSAYRRLVKKYHPDVNANSNAHTRFIEIQNAYKTLIDPISKKQYDRERAYSNPSPKKQTVSNPGDLLSECLRLNRALAQMDSYRINQKALIHYLQMLLQDNAIIMLNNSKDNITTQKIITEVLSSCNYIEARRVGSVINRLHAINCPVETIRQLVVYAKKRKKEAKQKKALPFVIIGVTLLLCVLMFWYCNIQ